MSTINQELALGSDPGKVEVLTRPTHPEHFEVHHENGEALMCMSSNGECRILVEIAAGYTPEEEQQLLSSTQSSLKAIDQFTDGRAADIFTGLHIKIGEDVTSGGAQALAEENLVILSGKKMLLNVAEMKQASGTYSDDELVDFPDEYRIGGALEYTLVHELGHILDGRTEAGDAYHRVESSESPTKYGHELDEWHSDNKDHEAFAECFAHAVWGMPISQEMVQVIHRTIDARIRETNSGELILPPKLAEIVTPERIKENERRLLASAPEVDEARLAEAKEKLLGLQLIHSTDEKSGFHHGIVPHIQHTSSESAGHTFALDRSLGMDRVVFFSWPLVPDMQNFGNNKLLVTADLLLDEHCFVTPRDWFESARPEEDQQGSPIELSDEEQERQELVYEDFYDGTSYDDLSESIENPEPTGYQDIHIPADEVKSIREKIMHQLDNNYFGKMVSGRVWLEYVAREFTGHGPEAIPLGEIKFYGKVPSGKIEAAVSIEEFDDTYVPHVYEILGKD